jgi:predicted enzyme related to lactoylglutathione lyase
MSSLPNKSASTRVYVDSLYDIKAFYAAAFPNWSFREETSKDENGGEVIHFSAGKPESRCLPYTLPNQGAPP